LLYYDGGYREKQCALLYFSLLSPSPTFPLDDTCITYSFNFIEKLAVIKDKEKGTRALRNW